MGWNTMYITIALVAAFFTALWGWRKGFLHLLLRLSALLLAYAFTWQETPAFAAYIAEKGWLTGVLVWPLAGLLLFFTGSIVFSCWRGFWFALRQTIGSVAANGQGIAGAVLGCGLGMLLVWTTGALQDAWRMRMAQQSAPVQTPSTSEKTTSLSEADRIVRNLSGNAMSALAQGALGQGPAATAAGRWMRDPLAMSEELKHLTSKPELRQLFENPANYNVLVRGSTVDIQRLPAFQSLTGDAKVMQFLSAVGLPGEALPQQSQALAGMLSRYAGNFEKLRKTPEFQALAQDPELRMKLQQGNVLALLTDDKMRRLAAMLAHGEQPPGVGSADGVGLAGSEEFASLGQDKQEQKTPEENLPKKILYQWKDEKGRMHFTEDKPPEGVKADVIQP
ncbi:MAG: DUF4124 domain-containing protein [Cellvibrionales bacterium]|nr:DUF4124 domain-containing protein [Cellvibrionales bacterium]